MVFAGDLVSVCTTLVTPALDHMNGNAISLVPPNTKRKERFNLSVSFEQQNAIHSDEQTLAIFK